MANWPWLNKHIKTSFLTEANTLNTLQHHTCAKTCLKFANET